MADTHLSIGRSYGGAEFLRALTKQSGVPKSLLFDRQIGGDFRALFVGFLL
jgi:hypothetical protein